MLFASTLKRPRAGRVRRIAAVSALAALMAVGCGEDSAEPDPTPGPGPGGNPADTAGAVYITNPVVAPATPDPGPAAGVTPVAHHGRLRTEGAYIVNQHGRAAQLRGMSLYWSIQTTGRQFYNAQAVDFLAKDWKASVVRAAMGVEDSFGGDQQGYIANPAANRDRVVTVVDAAIASGIYAIIDWHSHKAENNQSQAVSFFQEMSAKYKDYPNVIYEIYNEPTTSGSMTDDLYWQAIKPYMQAVTNAIRANDPSNLIIIGNPRWCLLPDLAAASPVTGANIAYTAHFYAGEATNSEATLNHTARLRERIYRTMQMGFPVFVTEFGTVAADGAGAVNTAQTDIWMDFMDQFHIGWANWSLSSLSESSAALMPGAPTTGNWNSNLSASGSYIRTRHQTPRKAVPAFYTAKVRQIGQGEVAVSPRPATQQLFTAGQTVSLIAEPAPGWRFAGWAGTHPSTETMLTHMLTGNLDVVARFEPQ
ncbi:MAG: cellulase family glycosylhydrolase [Chitinispirillia bacterium]|nr:cellulase family glycosylhydrolase [Chitinispirillia bacterium]MCL2241673.1 cellulase family glycosylhydrolase [Chitinispirillia bacterium]